MTEEWNDWDLKNNLTVEDAGCGHGYAILDGLPMFDSMKEAQEYKDKLVSMVKLEQLVKERINKIDKIPMNDEDFIFTALRKERKELLSLIEESKK